MFMQCSKETCKQQAEELARAKATIRQVRELHRSSRSTIWSHALQQAITVTTCRCGSGQYPCETIRAIEEER